MNFGLNIGGATEDALKVMGLKFPFTTSELRKARNEKMKVHHTDVGGDHSMSVKVNAAFDLLKNLASEDLEAGNADHVFMKKTLVKHNLKVYDNCERCHGTGGIMFNEQIKYCSTCIDHKNRKPWAFDEDLPRKGIIWVDCDDCKGSGRFFFPNSTDGKSVKCKKCSGTGKRGKTCPECLGKKMYRVGGRIDNCPECKGYGEKELKLWNSVLKPGGVAGNGTKAKRVRR